MSETWKRGDRIRVRKGAMVRSMHPSRCGKYALKRAQVVKIHDVYRWPDVLPHSIVWAGSGGYWIEADVTDCELVEPSA